MHHLLKKIFKSMTNSRQRSVLKRWKRHVTMALRRPPETTLAELEDILRNDFGITAGDRIFLSSSFGILNASGYSPRDVIVLLQNIVTDEGVVMMPYYPAMNAAECMSKAYCFDMLETASGMGIVTNVFSKMPGVVKSVHPIKAVCVWGKDAFGIAKNHQTSETPYYWDSPYGKMLRTGCKSIGLGVPNMPMGHALEDVLSNNMYEYYLPDRYAFQVKREDGTVQKVETLVPRPDLTRFFFFFWNIICPESVQKRPFGGGCLFLAHHDEVMMQAMKESLRKGFTPYNCK